MPSWLLKTAVHRGISFLPARQTWNRFFQKYITRSISLSGAQFESKLKECDRHWTTFTSLRQNSADFTCFELGTGWHPIIPAGLYLCGASEIWTVDIDDALRPAAMARMWQLFSDYAARGALTALLPGLRADRLKTFLALSPSQESPAVVLAGLNIHYQVVDAQSVAVPAEKIDLYLSSAVLEYIPLPVLKGILAEARRILAPNGVMSHRLNLIDQFSYFDKSITPYNFLKFTAGKWHWLNSPLIYQNRLRISDFRKLFSDAGFEIVKEESTPGSIEDLKRVKLAPEFQAYRREDLLILHSYLTATPKHPPA